MALRLSQPADAPEQTPVRLDARAEACLKSGDLKGYKELFALAAQIEDPHRRYQARRALLEQGFAGTRSVPSKDVPAVFVSPWAEFRFRFLTNKGYRDGFDGLAVASLHAAYRLCAVLYYWERYQPGWNHQKRQRRGHRDDEAIAHR